MRRRRWRLLPPLVHDEDRAETVRLARKMRAEAEMQAYDRLPPSLRRAVRDSALGGSAFSLRVEMMALAAKYGLPESEVAAMMADNLAAAEDQEIAVFAAAYEKEFGVPFPHVAAGATVLRPR